MLNGTSHTRLYYVSTTIRSIIFKNLWLQNNSWNNKQGLNWGPCSFLKPVKGGVFYKAEFPFQSLRGNLCFWTRIMLFVIAILPLAYTFFYSCCVMLLTMHPPGFCHLPSTWNVEGIFLSDKDKAQYLNNLTAQSLFITLHKNLKL
jgi:hypothetical protein